MARNSVEGPSTWRPSRHASIGHNARRLPFAVAAVAARRGRRVPADPVVADPSRSGGTLAVDGRVGHRPHRAAAVHGGALDPAHRHRLGRPVVGHQQALGAVDDARRAGPGDSPEAGRRSATVADALLETGDPGGTPIRQDRTEPVQQRSGRGAYRPVESQQPDHRVIETHGCSEVGSASRCSAVVDPRIRRVPKPATVVGPAWATTARQPACGTQTGTHAEPGPTSFSSSSGLEAAFVRDSPDTAYSGA
jgi:hypothetical protein